MNFMKKRRYIIIALAVAAVVLCLIFLPKTQENVTGENLLQNSSFDELDADGLPTGWYTDAYSDAQGVTKFGVGDDMDADGHSAYIKNIEENDARFAQTVSVKPDSLYLLHGYIKASCEGGMGANLSVEGIYVFSDCVYDTFGSWEEVTLYGRTGPKQREMTVFMRLGGYSGEAAGEAWFDDVSLTEVSEVPDGYRASDLFKTSSAVYDDDEEDGTEGTGTARLLLCALFFLALCGVMFALSRRGVVIGGKQYGLIAALLFMLALLVRVLTALNVSGYDVDIGCFTAWANRMAEKGPAGFYADGYFCDYPPGYLLVLWVCGALGRLFQTGATEFLVKCPSILADLLGAYLLMRRARREKQGLLPLALGALYLLNPLMLLAGAGWGQSDGVMTLFLLLTVLFALDGKWRYALPSYMLSVLMKPQALMFGPLGLFALLLSVFRERENQKKLLRDVLYGLLLTAALCTAVALPFCIGKGGVKWLFELYASTMQSYAYAAVNACNLYFLFGENWASAASAVPRLLACALGAMLTLPAALAYLRAGGGRERRLLSVGLMAAGALTAVCGAVFTPSYTVLSAVLIVLCVLFCCAAYALQGGMKRLPFFGALLLLLLFNTGTMMHERYLFPAVILLLLSYALEKDARLLYLAVLVSLSAFLNVGCVLDRNIRIGGASGHLSAQLYGIESDMAGLEYLSAALNVLSCMAGIYIALSDGRTLPAKAAFEQGKENRLHKPSALSDEQADWLKTHRTDKKDWLILGAVMLLYAAVSFFHLGSTKAPQTFYVFEEPDEQVVFDLGENLEDFRMLYYGGIHSYDSDFTVEVSEDGEHWSEYTAEMKIGSLFQWKYVKSYASGDSRRLKGRYVRLTADRIGLTLFEVLFRDADGQVLPIEGVSDSFGKDVSALYDEQDTLDGEPGWYNSMYFDEIYHARTAYEHLHGLRTYETSHPPLGKVIMSWCIAVFGMTPFGWRFAGTLCGVLMLPGMYLMGRLLFKKRRYAVLSVSLLALDCMHFTQTRLATIDSFVVLFIIWDVYFMLRWFFEDFFGKQLWKTLIPLALSGLFMGLSVASKWTGCYAGVGLAILFFFGVYRRARAVGEAGKIPEKERDERAKTAAEQGTKRLLLTVSSCLLFFVAVPLIIYYLSYIPYFAYEGGVTVKRVIRAAVGTYFETGEVGGMLGYHSTPGLGMDHPYYSPWYEWPFSIRPMYYAADAYEPAGYACTILAFGNPAVWWTGFACLLLVLYAFARHQAYPALRGGYEEKCFVLAPKGERDVRPALLSVCFLAQFLPWMLVPRGTYIYHYFPSVPFIILCTAYVLERLQEYLCARFPAHERQADRLSLIGLSIYIGLTALLFIGFYPYASGTLTDTRWLDFMNWFGNLYY